MPRRTAVLLTCALPLALGGCGRGESSGTAGASPAAAENVAVFHAHLKAAAAGLDAMARVDDRSRWAPADCFAPSAPPLRASASADAATHGGKLYSVYAKDRGAYASLTVPSDRHPPTPTAVAGLEDCSQVVVKESFAPEEVKAGDASPRWTPFSEPASPTATGHGPARAAPPSARSDLARRLRPATKDGRRFRAGDSRGLFVMLRLDPKTPGTDDGWVYGTIAPDGTITSSGRVASCMSCHVSAPHGRLFGLPPDAGE